jgi:hypothetical protein
MRGGSVMQGSDRAPAARSFLMPKKASSRGFFVGRTAASCSGRVALVALYGAVRQVHRRHKELGRWSPFFVSAICFCDFLENNRPFKSDGSIELVDRIEGGLGYNPWIHKH